MSDIRIDYSRADMERRMELLCMAGGDVRRAMELERWVRVGEVQFVTPASFGGDRKHVTPVTGRPTIKGKVPSSYPPSAKPPRRGP